MNKKNSQWLFSALVVIGVIIKLFFLLQQKPLWWDTSVYIGMTKYITSGGAQGLWEPLRPPIWPLIISFFSFLGLPLIFFAKITQLLFSLGSVLLVFLIAKKLWGTEEARIASLLLLFTPVIVFYEGVMLTEIPAVFFGVLAVYFLVNEKYFLAGIFSGISFLTKFPMGLIFLGLVVSIISFKRNNILKLFFGFLIPVIIFLFVNFLIYQDPLLPLKEGSEIFEKSSWFYEKGSSYYFIELIKENVFFIFGLMGLFFLRKRKELALSLSFLFLFFYFGYIPHKEVRFYVLFLPFLALVSAKGIAEILKYKYSKFILFALIILFVPLAYGKFVDYYNFKVGFDEQYYSLIKNYDTKEALVSDPRFTLFSDKKLDLLYYKDYDEPTVMKKLRDAELVITNTCDIVCKNCEIKEKMFDYLKNNFATDYKEEKNNCTVFVFTRQT
ncbi:glycosyltransferase family 39 protein [Candidatus Woesearchaeota archaeon]|nr:glycosyltransferase family 39 protein [Candidatus Woesearchaeota archaeon]